MALLRAPWEATESPQEIRHMYTKEDTRGKEENIQSVSHFPHAPSPVTSTQVATLLLSSSFFRARQAFFLSPGGSLHVIQENPH